MSRTIKAGCVYRQYTKDGVFIADYQLARLPEQPMERERPEGVICGGWFRRIHRRIPLRWILPAELGIMTSVL